MAVVVSLADLVSGPSESADGRPPLSDGAGPDVSARGVSSASCGGVASPATLEDAADRANHYAGRSKSPATITYAGHSLRAGLATSAAAGRASERAIMAQTGHRSTDMVRRYIREANLFAAENAASLAGL